MKRKIMGILLVFIFALLALSTSSDATNYKNQYDKTMIPLDEIEDYTITIDMNKDGSMDIKYHIEWKVLNSTIEGPLEWVQIGIPNANVSNVKKLTSNIKKAKYNYDYGNYVRIDFHRKYYAGEIVTFEFSIKQSHMYTINSDGTCIYGFTPGWFDNINVKKATIKWNRNNMINATNGSKLDEYGYIVWTKEIPKGQKMSVQATFNQSAFKLDKNKQAKDAKTRGSNPYSMIYIVIFIVAIIISIIRISLRNTYYRHSGFGYDPYYRRSYYRGGFWGSRRRRSEEVHLVLV